jgi:hypothetical protein
MWYVLRGSFAVKWIDTDTGSIGFTTLKQGEVWVNERLFPHQLIADEDNSVIIEVSTEDDENDNYRIFPGDSQQ